VQLYQLRFGNEYTSIQTPFTLKALTEMSTAGLIGSEDAEILKNAWTLSSSIRSGIVLATGKKNDVLPNDQRVLESIRQLLHLPGIESGAELEQEYLAASRKARAIFENLFFA
jgi:glutamate-ammonia-ligase adenylyltransferase